ncbi:hypothetical protein [Halorubrum halophilum]|uniref:hypothetical protein n=1 Tax=Halorubrum halophilum TaxID=413816 RepID=UPI001D02D58B|nr:hypothetical protein [Halorubrum halophilum]
MGTRSFRFVVAQMAGMLASLIMLTLLGAFSYELFFVLSLISLLVVTELTAPFQITPTWRRRLLWVILVGLSGFAYIVIRRIQMILENS